MVDVNEVIAPLLLSAIVGNCASNHLTKHILFIAYILEVLIRKLHDTAVEAHSQDSHYSNDKSI